MFTKAYSRLLIGSARTIPENWKGLINLVSLVILADAFILILVLSSSSPYTVLRENGVIENSTAVIYFATAALATYSLAVRKYILPSHQKWLIFLSFAGLVAGLEEISYGVQFFGIDAPFFHDIRIDGIHDLFEIAVSYSGIQGNILMGVTVILALIVFCVVYVYRSVALRKRLVSVPESDNFSIYASACLAGLCLVLAVLIDTDYFGPIQRSFAVEEVLEMNAAMFLIGIWGMINWFKKRD